MNINDLENCEVVESANQIIGGAVAYVDGKANAKPGKADANVVALGYGKNNKTSTRTSARVRPKYSTASYSGYAVARDGRKYSIDYDYGSDYSYGW